MGDRKEPPPITIVLELGHKATIRWAFQPPPPPQQWKSCFKDTVTKSVSAFGKLEQASLKGLLEGFSQLVNDFIEASRYCEYQDFKRCTYTKKARICFLGP
jgi:hypothetical protein